VATTNDLKNGIALNLDGQLWTVVEFQHVKPGKGGAFVRTKLKNILSGKVVDRTFNAGVKVDVANVDRREMQYLYREGGDFVFMDMTDYDQPRVPAVRRPAGRGRAHHQPDRPWRAGRPLHRWHQAGHPPDRRDHPGAAVHLDRREDQG